LANFFFKEREADLYCHFPRDGKTELYQILGGQSGIIDALEIALDFRYYCPAWKHGRLKWRCGRKL